MNRDLPEDRIESRRDFFRAVSGHPLSADESSEKLAHAHSVTEGLIEWDNREMSGNIQGNLIRLGDFILLYPKFHEVPYPTSELTPLMLVYKTAIRRLSEYHWGCLLSLASGRSFPAYSMFRSAMETIGVLCWVTDHPEDAERWTGFNEEGPIHKQNTPFATPLLRECRSKTYPDKGVIEIYKKTPQPHLLAFPENMWDILNSIDHFSDESVSMVFEKRIVETRIELLETFSVEPVNLITPIAILWTLIAEGFNHLYLAGRLLGLDEAVLQEFAPENPLKTIR